MIIMSQLLLFVLLFLFKVAIAIDYDEDTVDRHAAFNRYLRQSYNNTTIQQQQQQQQQRQQHNSRQLQFLNSFSIVKAGQLSTSSDAEVILGTWTSGSTIDIAQYQTFDISLIVYTSSVTYARVELEFETPLRLDYVAPWSLRGQIGNSYISSKWMKILGPKTIKCRGYNSRNRLLSSTTISFTLIDTSQQQTLPPTQQQTLPPTQQQLPCTIPQFSGVWEKLPGYPLNIGESQGGIVNGRDFIVLSGFSGSYGNTTLKSYSLDVSTTATPLTGTWIEQDSIRAISGGFDNVGGLTHAAFVIVKNKIYLCGGSIGGIPHPTTDLCHVYDHTAPRGQQWSYLPSLPAKRAGAGIVYDKNSNSLIFGGGSFLVNNTVRSSTTDYNDVWQLYLNNINAGWIRKANFPYFGNHLGSVTVLKDGIEKHFFLGGQLKANEPSGNLRDVFEYIPTTDTWVRKASMLFERSHFSSSTTPYKQCGIIIAGGARNGSPTSQRLTDISYYSIDTDSWIKIGDMPDARNTPICTINNNDGYYYCITGAVAGPWGYRRKID